MPPFFPSLVETEEFSSSVYSGQFSQVRVESAKDKTLAILKKMPLGEMNLRLGLGCDSLQGLWTIFSFPCNSLLPISNHPKRKIVLSLNSLTYTRHSEATMKNGKIKPIRLKLKGRLIFFFLLEGVEDRMSEPAFDWRAS